jgi:sugar lactone lactonase YvrE
MPGALSALLDSTQPERLATGFVFTEGPLWHPEGFYYFVDIRQSRLHRVFPGKAPELVRDRTGVRSAGAPGHLRGRQPARHALVEPDPERDPDGPLGGQAPQPSQ